MGTAEKTIERLREFAEDIMIPSGDTPYHNIIFPLASNADYCFTAFIYDDGEPQVAARRIGSDEDKAFWYHPFERPDYESTGAQHKAFLDTTLLLLRHTTRIIQSGGILSWSFDCEYLINKKWQPICGHAFFKYGGFKPPEIEGKQHIYTSGAVVNENTGTEVTE